MHELINDLAQWIMGDTIMRLGEGSEPNKQSKKFEKVRHSSHISDYYDGKDKFLIFDEVEKLRTFLPMRMRGENSYITNMVLSDLLPKFKKLRVLSLRGYYITALPNSIGQLKHLRFLNLSGTLIRTLPESTSSLYNLQNLLLRGCSRLLELPSNFGNLINLRRLLIEGANLIEEMPLGMEKLKKSSIVIQFYCG